MDTPKFILKLSLFNRVISKIYVPGGEKSSDTPMWHIVRGESGLAPDWRHVEAFAYSTKEGAIADCGPHDRVISHEESCDWQYQYYRNNRDVY